MATERKQLPLRPPKNPNIPIAPVQYDQRYQDQMLNALRLYFNQIDNFGASLTGSGGGVNISFPHIAAGDNAAQYATANNTPTIVKWNTNYSSTGFTLNIDNTATAAYDGIYKITYSAQIANTDNAAHDAIFWLRVNGTDVTASSTIFTVPARKSAGIPSYVCGYSEVVFEMKAGDTVGLWWGTDLAASSGGAVGNYLYYRAAQTTPMPYPSVPSVIGSITFVSALY